jgi:hypothetical protein
MTWHWTIFAALVVVATGALYIQLRWRRSPHAYRAMVALAAIYFVAGSLTGAWIMRLATRASFARPTQLATLGMAPSVSVAANRWGWDPGRAVLPNSKLTPGDTIPGVTVDDVCTPGWATDHRHVTETMRVQVYREYGFNFDYCQGPEPGVASQACEVDHLIPLELGGSNDMKNLWPQPYSCTLKAMCGATYDPRPGAAEKDQLENELHRLVCHGKLTLTDAQRCIASHWVTCWEKYMLPVYGTASK